MSADEGTDYKLVWVRPCFAGEHDPVLDERLGYYLPVEAHCMRCGALAGVVTLQPS